MPLYDPSYPARYAAPLLELLHAAGGDMAQRVLAAAELDEAAFHDAEYRLGIASFDALVCAASQCLKRDDLGFEMGQRVRLDHHLSLSIALRRCQSLDELLRLLSRFSRLITTAFSLHYRRSASHGELVCRPAAPMSSTTLHYLQEQYAVAVHHECRALFGKRLLPMDVYLSLEAPAHLARYARLVPSRFHFGALPMPEVQFCIPLAMLDQKPDWPEVVPLPLGAQAQFSEADTSTSALQEKQSNIQQADDWGNWVELILREAEGCQPSREELAALLNISPSTLTRYLHAEGRSLRSMGKQIRHQRACQLLAETDQAISQIAYRLGYSDLANFSHAFQSEAGISPRTYRQRTRAQLTDQASTST